QQTSERPVRDHEVRPFTDRQIDLLKTFADQFARLLGLEQPRILNADLVTLTQERDAEDRPIVASALCLVKGICGVSENVRDLHWLPLRPRTHDGPPCSRVLGGAGPFR